MKTTTIQQIIKGCFAVATVGFLTLSCVSANAEFLVGLSYPSTGGGDNDVFTIDSSAPGAILQTHPITGLASSEQLRGIDFWNNTVYGLGSGGNLYTLDYNTGAAKLVGNFGVLNGASFGVDNEAAGFRIVSELDMNYLVNRTTGALISSSPTLTPASLNITALAYNGNTMFAIDSLANTLGVLNTGAGTYTTIGAMGFDVARNNGFDISGATGIAYLASGATSSDVQANLYTVDLSTGMASLVGLIANPGDNILVRGLTVVPEPATATMLVGGLAFLALSIRRRQ